MADRETVIRGLEYCIYDAHDGGCNPDCPYFGRCTEKGGVPSVLYDVLSLLKEGEPRVLTAEEIRWGIFSVVWLEDRDKSGVIPGLWFRLSDKGEDEAVDIHVMDGFVGARLAVYGKLWRAWTAKPTEEQRKAVAWE